jgi:hypothetical protein
VEALPVGEEDTGARVIGLSMSASHGSNNVKSVRKLFWNELS